MSDRDFDYLPNPDDERVEILDAEFEPDAPPTLDPDERIEEADDIDPEAPGDA